MTVAADPDPYYALPKLYGAPAYGRGPRAVPETERPPDPDDLPITAEQTADERALSASLQASGSHLLGRPLLPADGRGRVPPASDDNGRSGIGGRRLSLHALTARLGQRGR